MEPAAYARRLTVLPGLTGAWQVGGRSETDSLGMLRLDLDYIERWSLRRDLGILCLTVGAVLRGRGAY
jgi:lipopolysaccharide/colanic/teichoic acid biosynthesis glycosyltransferase